MSDITFRNITKSDLDEVFILLNQLKEKDISSINKNLVWRNFLENTSSNSLVGLYKGKIIAYGSIVIENKIRGEVAGHIEDIVVDRDISGKMIGNRLVNQLIKVGEDKGCYRITLFCNKKLVTFYERNGFKVNNIIMKKFL